MISFCRLSHERGLRLFGEWRGAFERRGLKVNLEKTKLLVMGG